MIRPAAGLLLFCISGFAAVEHDIIGVFGPRNLYRGYDAWVRVEMGWYDFKECSVDTGTDRVTATGHGLKNGDVVRAYSPDGTLPSPLNTHFQYAVEAATEDTFKLNVIGIPIDFQNTGQGTAKIGKPVSGGGHVYMSGVSGLPQGINLEYYCSGGLGTCWYNQATQRFWSYGGLTFWVRFHADAEAELGSTTVKLTLSLADQPDKEVSIPLTVQELEPVTLSQPVEFPPIPGKRLWESLMLDQKVGAPKWCPDAENPAEKFYFGVESQVWYYDGAWAYYQIADYTGDKKWENCARNISRQYMEYVNLGEGGAPAWRIFTDGLVRSARDTDLAQPGRDAEAATAAAARKRSTAAEQSDPYRRALYLLVKGRAPFAATGGDPRDDLIRETAYRLETYVNYEIVFGERHPMMVRSADLLLGMFDVLFVVENPTIHQTAYDGLAMRALIRYYELTGDARIPRAVKTALDWIWDKGWDASSKRLVYNPAPYGPQCLSLCREYANNLIHLTAPAYAWYWSITGDDTYRIRGDEMFEHAFDDPGYGLYSGKQFSQNFRWSFDYVKWREGKPLFQPLRRQ